MSKTSPKNVSTRPIAQQGYHNAVFRFALELGALGTMGWWGHHQTESPSRYALMLAVPIVAAAIWGIFAVSNDPSRGGTPVVEVRGVIRLAIEFAVFGFASWALYDLGRPRMALGFGGATVLHYALSHERLRWLMHQ